MNLNDRLAKLRQQQKQINEALRQAESEASERHRKAENRAKFILGGALFSMSSTERETILPMFMERIPERDRQFVTECLAGSQNE